MVNVIKISNYIHISFLGVNDELKLKQNEKKKLIE
jgi:hypothetical protein